MGHARICMQDRDQHTVDQQELMETLAAIQEGLASAERVELKPAAKVFAEMRAKYGLRGSANGSAG